MLFCQWTMLGARYNHHHHHHQALESLHINTLILLSTSLLRIRHSADINLHNFQPVQLFFLERTPDGQAFCRRVLASHHSYIVRE